MLADGGRSYRSGAWELQARQLVCGDIIRTNSGSPPLLLILVLPIQSAGTR